MRRAGPSNSDRRFLRPQAWPPENRRPVDPNRQLPAFTVLLFHTSRNQRRDLLVSVVDTLIKLSPSPPVQSFTHSSGVIAGRLLFNRWAEAVDAAVLFWGRRLDGTHTLTTVIEASSYAPPHNRAEEECRLRTLFSERIRCLLDCDAVRKCEEKIEKVTDEIHKLHRQLSRPKSYALLDNLTDKRKKLEVEREQLKGRLAEFRAAMDCLLAQISENPKRVISNEEKKEEVEILKLESKIDWSRLHGLMERERQRLEEGLPIYACRKKILSYIFANQAVVLIGETGSGKSTQLVQFLADCGMGGEGSILCTQPRKLAATSLAQRVTLESAGCYPYNYISSYASYSSSQQFGSGVKFMTDHCLLQHYMSNSCLPGISCIVIDEAHERSLSSDLLFALIKKKLVGNSNLRLVIMSATADASTLAQYFFGCYTFYIMGRNFPVDIKYIPDVPSKPYGSAYQKDFSGKCSYVFDVLNMVSMIHKTEQAGDILAFLTSQSEVEWACEIFHDPSAVVLPLHGKLSSEEQSLVFQIYPGKRKVIFSTNVAETSLTIKGVKFVVDSGMVKESRFEPSNGMNVLKVCRISQSSANQRAGRAGRTEPGKCYRLYSESDFRAMQMHQDPEIRKVHLGVAVLRILALGIKNVQEFEFVDAPCPKAIEIAIKNLIQLGAVTSKNDGLELTDTGRHIVKLGVEPRVGKLILGCLDHGLRKEGLVLAAMMANANSIFCRIGSNEDKYKADCLRVPFCHHFGDLFTLLSVYMRWEAEHSNRNRWCWENSINAKSMRRCHEAVSELENCLEQELSIIIPSFWLWNPDEPSKNDKLLKKVILSSLAGNLAMYSGYDQLGYEVALTGQHVQLHPSSSLLVYGQKPDWVVFGEILSLPNQYLVCVTSVDHDALFTIEPPLFDVPEIESRKMQVNVISGFGTNVVKRFCGKQNQNLQRIISDIRRLCSDERVSIEIEFEKIEIHVYASMKDLNAVSCIVKESLSYEMKHLRNECMEKCLFLGRTGTCPPLALFGSGAEIKHLELENQCLSVEISHPNAYTLHDKELILLVEYYVSGIVSFYKYAGNGQEGADINKWGRITFLNPELAEEAVAKLNDLELDGSLLKVVATKTGDQKILPFPAVRAKVLWPRKPSKGIALVKCAPGEAELIKNDCFALAVGDRFVNCEVSTRYPNCLFVTGVPKDVLEAEIYDAFASLTSRRILDIHILRGETVPTPPLSTCEDAIRREISQFMPKRHFPDQHFRVEVFNPEQRDSMIRAAITFDGSLHLEAAKALDHIQGKVLPGFLSWQKIQCQHVFQSTLCCSSRIYSVIRSQLNSILEDFKCQRGVSYNLEQNFNGTYRVRISANATKTIADLRKPLEQLMQGTTVSHPSLTITALQLILSRDGVALMKSVERETGTYVLYDRQNLKVRVFGPPKEVRAAEEKLIKSLLSLHENKQLEIRLRGHDLPSSLMKEVVQRFGSDLSGLREKVNGVEVTLNTRRHTVSVRASKETKQKVENLISEVAQSIGQNGTFEQPLESSCPICLCELEEPYRLEDCGHEFCRSCLVDQCESAIRSHDQLPLCCAMDGCKKLILLVDLKSLLAAEKLEELFRASLSSFVASSDGTYRFCPSPDCPSVYRVHDYDADVGPFVCGACFVETCTKCHVEYHPFLSCERYKEYKEDPDLSLTDWRKGKENVKSCPACRHTIEKAEGCNHIECRCGWHICWVCLETFRSGEECYKHLSSVHQSFI